jgi:ABC-type multidrug transport system ATPase subunit
MKIKLHNGGKRFNREWIFRNAALEFTSGNAYAITGHNGSGKSTLLQCLAGMLQLSEGSILYEDELPVTPETAYRQTSFCAPYMEVIEEMSLKEFLQFHQQFKLTLPNFTIDEIIEAIGLQEAATKQIRYYSSGMKQRVKLAQAVFFDTAIVLLDEPCSNLDDKGIALYHELVQKYCSNRIVIVCSNDPVEYNFAKEIIAITDYKKPRKVV